MATAFQKGNRRATASSEHASVYLPNGIAAITNLSSVPTGANSVIQSVVPWQFKGGGQIEVTLPPGFTLPNGVFLGQSYLVANSSGSYAAGFHPIVQYQINNATGANVNINATDVFIVQY